MKYSVIFLAGCLCIASCSEMKKSGNDFQEVDPSNTRIVDGIETGRADTILVENVSDKLYIESLIEEAYYVPLETTDESLFAYNRKTIVYKDRIYVLDDVLARAVLIFDMNGKFLRKIGKQGGAPNEFALLLGMTIDEKNDRLVLFDSMKQKLMYFTLDGDYIKNSDINIDFCGQMEILPSGNMVAAVSKSNMNVHLGELDDYRILQSDSLGNIVKAGFKRDDNKKLMIIYESMFRSGKDIVYHPPFLNALYTIGDDAISERYVVEYKDYPPIDQEELLELPNLNRMREFEQKTVFLFGSALAETPSHLYFSTMAKHRFFYTIYDKRAKKQLSFRNIRFRSGLIMAPAPMYSYGDYFIGQATAEQIIAMREFLKREGRPIPPQYQQYQELFNNIREDDNPVLVFFKLKDFSTINESDGKLQE